MQENLNFFKDENTKIKNKLKAKKYLQTGSSINNSNLKKAEKLHSQTPPLVMDKIDVNASLTTKEVDRLTPKPRPAKSKKRYGQKC